MVRLWEAVAIGEPLAAHLADGVIVSILSHLLLKTGRVKDGASQIALPQWRLKRVTEYADRNLERAISLEELSAAAGLSRRHFARSFCGEVGVTPHKWLMQRRLDKAQELLVTTAYPLCDIAQMCGFSSQSHLTSLMKQQCGVTPNRWRQQHRS
jgi:AraC family transcriptional regulator